MYVVTTIVFFAILTIAMLFVPLVWQRLRTKLADSNEDGNVTVTQPDAANASTLTQGTPRFFKATFISNEEPLRNLARDFGFENVDIHPTRIGEMKPSEFLIVDLDNVLFGDQATAVQKALEHARQGVHVGLVTHYLDRPCLDPVRGERIVHVRTTLEEVWTALVLGEPIGPLPPRSSAGEDVDLKLLLKCAQEEIVASQTSGAKIPKASRSKVRA